MKWRSSGILGAVLLAVVCAQTEVARASGGPDEEWFCVTPSAAFSPRVGHAVVSFGDYVYVMGGSTSADLTSMVSGALPDVWKSKDGVLWEEVVHAAAFGPRVGHAAVVYNGKIWVIGGMRSGTTGNVEVLGDVWSSSDGTNWTQRTDTPAWSARVGHRAELFDGKLWVLGGSYHISGVSGESYNCVSDAAWAMSENLDGTTAWEPKSFLSGGRETLRHFPGSAVFNNTLWVLGGSATMQIPLGDLLTGCLKDLWQLQDGMWQGPQTAPWPARMSFGCVVHNGEMWVLGGWGAGSDHVIDDAWRSSTGGGWTLLPVSWSGRAFLGAVEHGNRIWVVGGMTSPAASTFAAMNDVWLTGVSLTALQMFGGAIDAFPPQSDAGYALNTELTLAAKPEPGYAFGGWSGALSGLDNPATLVMNAPLSVGALFTRIESEGEDEVVACFARCPEDSPDNDGDGLSACREACIGTSDTRVDTDNDGMPDGWEAQHSLNPLVDDSEEDADNDGLTNLEEYLGRSDPQNPASPNRVVFVSTAGSDAYEQNSFTTPFQTITHALERTGGATASNPVRIVLLPGTYTGEGGNPIELAPFVELVSRKQDPPSTIVGGVMGAQDTLLSNLRIVSGSASPGWLLQMNLCRMRVSGVTLEGSAETRSGSGITVYGAPPLETVIEGCEFRNLQFGIEVYGGLPTIRRCIFEDLSGSGIVVHPWDDPLAGAGTLGDAGDPGTGWNFFSLNIDGPAVINGRGAAIQMENNDWGTDDPAAIDGRIQGPNIHGSFLATGNSILASAIFCSVVDAGSGVPVTDAAVTLQVSAYRPVTKNSRGLYAFPAVPDGAYTVTATAPGRHSAQRTVSVGQGVTKSVPLPLAAIGPAEGEGEGEGVAEGEGEGEDGNGDDCRGCGRDKGLPASGDLFVSALALIAMASVPRKGGHGA